MRYIIFILFILIFSIFELFGQTKLHRPVEELIEVPFHIIRNDNQYQPQFDFAKITDEDKNTLHKFFDIKPLNLVDGDLNFEYLTKGIERGWSYRLNFRIDVNEEERFPLYLPFSSGTKDTIYFKQRKNKCFVNWENITENRDFKLNNDYILRINHEIWDNNLDCSPKAEPTFKFWDQWPHYVVALVGSGLIVGGEITKQNAKDIYSDYEDLWANEGLLSEGQRLFSDFNTKKDKHTALNVSGIVVLTGNAIVYLVRFFSYLEKKDKYNKYCKSSVPTIEVEPISYGIEAPIGLKATYTFQFKK